MVSFYMAPTATDLALKDTLNYLHLSHPSRLLEDLRDHETLFFLEFDGLEFDFESSSHLILQILCTGKAAS